jgi:hypothetical protein
MNEIILKKIANTILINTQYIDAVNLFSGKTGIALFLYGYGNNYGKESYVSYADELIDEVIETIAKQKNKGNEYTLSSIGWILNYLLKKNYLDGEPDDVLADMDDLIFDSNSNLANVISTKFPYLFNCHYLFCRIKDNQINNTQHQYILKIIEYFKNVLIREDGSDVSLDFLNSALYFVIKILNTYNYESTDITDYLSLKINKALDNYLFDISDLKTLSRLLDNEDIAKECGFLNIKEKSDNLLKKVDHDDIKTFIKDGIQNLIFFENKCANSSDIEINNHVDELISNLSKDDLYLCDGLAGIGFRLLQM